MGSSSLYFGGSYILSFFARSAIRGQSIQTAVYEEDATLPIQVLAGSGVANHSIASENTWQRFSHEFTAGRDATTVRIRIMPLKSGPLMNISEEDCDASLTYGRDGSGLVELT